MTTEDRSLTTRCSFSFPSSLDMYLCITESWMRGFVYFPAENLELSGDVSAATPVWVPSCARWISSGIPGQDIKSALSDTTKITFADAKSPQALALP